MSLPKKRVRTLHDRLKIIQEVEKNPGEKRVDIAKQFGLPTSTLNLYSPRRMRYANKYRNVVTRARTEKLARSQHLLNWKTFQRQTHCAMMC
jgi:hypothetical protein